VTRANCPLRATATLVGGPIMLVDVRTVPSTRGGFWPMSMTDTESGVRLAGASPGRSCLPSLAETAIWAAAGRGANSAAASRMVFMDSLS